MHQLEKSLLLSITEIECTGMKPETNTFNNNRPLFTHKLGKMLLILYFLGKV